MDQEEWDEDPDEDTGENKRKKKKVILILLLILVVVILLAAVSYSLGAWKLLVKIFPGSKLNYQQTSRLITPGELKGENTGNINVLLLGMRGEGENYPYLTNAVMVLNYHKDGQKINLISLPRDFWISTDKYGDKKISYICDTSNFKSNPTTCFDTGRFVIKNSLGVEINYVFLLDFKGFSEVVDRAGKIDVDVTGHLKEWTFLSEPDFAGAQDAKNPNLFHLNGKQALIYVRWPENALPDFNRLERQQQMMKAAENVIVSPNLLLNPDKLSSVLQSASINVKTDFQLWEAKKFSELLKNVQSENINKYSLTSVSGSDGGLLTRTHFAEAETLSPIAGIHDFSQIHSWVRSKMK